jgi:hypothetical protein
MNMAEYTELQLKAKEEGIKSWHVKSDEVLAAELAEKWATPLVPEDENDEVVISETVKEAPKAPPAPSAAAPVPEGKVTFYWKGKRNIEFTIETAKATPTSLRQATSFASKDSVIVLDPANPVEKQAIEKLRKSPKFKIDFDEVEHRRVTPDKKGAKLDELMELDHKVLVQMVGGSVQDSRKTRGELIQQIMAD